jgi:hypothetical protein
MMAPFKPEEIARVCHEANRAYCLALGDTSHFHWEHAPEWQKTSAIAGVLYRQQNTGASAKSMHESWSKQKREDGWVFGREKDPVKKTHPCLVAYEDLPEEQRVKDYLFSAIFDTLSGE